MRPIKYCPCCGSNRISYEEDTCYLLCHACDGQYTIFDEDDMTNEFVDEDVEDEGDDDA
jgi:uncharacterized protein (DUF983 family)